MGLGTPLDESLISLRPEGTAPRPLADILGPSGKQDVQGFLDTCLAPKEEVPDKLCDSGVEAVFLDPGLRRSPKRYRGVVQRMHRASMIDWQLESPKEVIGFFAV